MIETAPQPPAADATPTTGRRLALLLLASAVALQMFLLRHEIAIGVLDLNDNVLHATLIERMGQALAAAENPIDHWVSEWTLGYPVPRTYQPLGHLMVALLHRGLGDSVEPVTLFAWVRYLLLCLWPATLYLSARWLALPPLVAAAAALVAPWAATDGLSGLEYGSYLWRGSGLYTQSWGMHLLALSLGLAYQAIRHGRRLVLAGLLLALTFLAHFIYGYMGALSIVLLTILPTDAASPRLRMTRLAGLGILTAALTAFQLLPLLLDAPWINRSRWEPAWKWDSFGARDVGGRLISGELLDFGRWPTLSLLALAGAAVVLIRRLAPGPARCLPRVGDTSALTYLLAGAGLWLLLFCGRPTFGNLYALLGADDALQLHRLIGGAHLFLILLAGVARGTRCRLIFRGLPRRWPATAVSLLATVLLFEPVLEERQRFLHWNRAWGEANLAAYRAQAEHLSRTLERAAESPGRLYAGLGGRWGKDFKVGSLPLYAFLSRAHLPAVSYLYHAMALTADLMVHFDENNPAHYQLFNVRTVLADASRQMPPFLTPLARHGRFQIWRGPQSGYFDLVAVPYAVRVDKESFYHVGLRWLDSGWSVRKQHLRLDFTDSADDNLPRLSPTEPLPGIGSARRLGEVEREQRDGEVYRVELRVDRAAYLLFKMTYHRNWRVRIDGELRPTVHLSPGFLGVALEPGRHEIECRYRAEGWKTGLLALTMPCLLLATWMERRGLFGGS